MSLATPPKVEKLQAALHTKAKKSPNYRQWLRELAEALRVSKAYHAVDQHVRRRLRQWLCVKHKVPGSGTSRFPDAYLHQNLGLVCLSVRTRNFSWAKV